MERLLAIHKITPKPLCIRLLFEPAHTDEKDNPAGNLRPSVPNFHHCELKFSVIIAPTAAVHEGGHLRQNATHPVGGMPTLF